MIRRAALIAGELKYGCIRYIAGGARGVDTWATGICLDLREELASLHGIKVRVEIFIPHKPPADRPDWVGQEHTTWSLADIKLYQSVLAACDAFVFVQETGYTDGCLDRRNKAMLQEMTGPDDLLIAIHNGKGGGTQNCINDAIRMGLRICAYNYTTHKFSHLGNWPSKQPIPKTCCET